MPNNTLNFFDTYIMIAIMEEVTPRATFFRDRYFTTGENDIIAADKVLVEYRKGDRRMAPFVSRRVGDIPMDRRGYTVSEYEPAYIAPSRLLTMDDLRKRGFGEALYARSTPAERAARLIRDDLTDLENFIVRHEEWMCAQVMINNACEMQTYVDATTEGEKLFVNYYDGPVSEHTFTVANKWDSGTGNYRFDVRAMCRMLSKRGLPAADLLLGSDVADFISEDKRTAELLDKNSGIFLGNGIREQLTAYDGVTFMGVLSFGGHNLNVFSVDERYLDDDDVDKPMLAPKDVIVTAPNCGSLKYGQITQIDFGAIAPTTYSARRVPKLVVDQENDQRKLRSGTRPLAVPKNYCPYIYAKDVLGN